MPRAPHRWSPFAPPPHRLVRPVRRDPDGITGPTRGQARGRGWRRTSQGFYVPASVDDSVPEQRIVEQSVRLPEGGAVTGWAGCRMSGANFFDGLLPDGRTMIPVPLVTGGRTIRVDGSVTVLRDRLQPEEVVIRHGVPCARAPRSLFDAMRRSRSVRAAVGAMDMMAAAELVSISRMARYLEAHPGWRGAPLVALALSLANEDSRSPNETRMRLIWVLDAGLPVPLVNQPVFDLAGNLLGIADLLDLEAGVVGEFDGADHRGARRHASDVRREDGLRRHGLEVFRVTGPDLGHREMLVARMFGARERARWEPPAQRRWTIVPPRSWDVPPSLDDVLDHHDVMRELHANP